MSFQKPKLLLRLWLINTNSLYCFLWRGSLQLHQVVCNIQTIAQLSQKTGLWRNIRYQVIAQSADECLACEQIKVANVLWWLTIIVTQVCAYFDVIYFFITLRYCLSTVVWVVQNIIIGYRQWKMKTLVWAQKCLIDKALP